MATRGGNLRAFAAGLMLLLSVSQCTHADGPAEALTPADAVRWALEHNPELATIRQQHGIAAAAVVIARTYPFNPLIQNLILADNGPASAGVTNHVFQEHTARLDLEIRGQGRHRRNMAQAALSRTDWEIANQETGLAVRVARASSAYLYRRDKLRLAEEALRLQEEVLKEITRYVEQGKVGRGELLFARADLADARVLRGPARTAFNLVTNDFRRLLGVLDQPVQLVGDLDAAVPPADAAALGQVALEQRPDLHALRLAVDEAEARLRLEIANRYGNPSVGPGFEYNETRAYFVGLWAVWPMPVLNTRRGEIQQRKAERDRAMAAVRQFEVQAQQEVQAAMTRLGDAVTAANTIRKETLPGLQNAREALDKLFSAGEPGVDLARVVDVRRRILRARDAYLDALWELHQARADLAAAVGDPTLALPPCVAPPAVGPHLP